MCSAVFCLFSNSRTKPTLFSAVPYRLRHRPEAVGVDNIAPTLSALLSVPAPSLAHGRRLF
jgi:hypothetical protein